MKCLGGGITQTHPSVSSYGENTTAEFLSGSNNGMLDIYFDKEVDDNAVATAENSDLEYDGAMDQFETVEVSHEGTEGHLGAQNYSGATEGLVKQG